MANHWCEMVEDANPIHHDDEYAKSTWLDGAFAPPTMLYAWGMQPVWPERDYERPLRDLTIEGCPNRVAVKTINEYEKPLRYGDTLTMTSQISEISEEKTTRLGTGHFVTATDTFRNQDEEIVGTHSFVLFIYGSGGDGS